LKQASGAISESQAHALQQNFRCGNAPTALEPSWSSAPFVGMDFEMGYFARVRALILDRFRRARRRRFLVLLLAGLTFSPLAACSSAPSATYDLTAATGGFAARAGRGQLAVLLPDATLPADSDRIVVRTTPQSVAYLSGAQWVDKLPSLIQSRLVESFQNAHLLRAAGRPGMLADFSLQTNIRRFELDAARSEAIVEISAQIIGPSGRIVGGQIFAANVAAPARDPAAVASALDAALRQIMREIVIWTAPKV
jgi:cholesterol transport system auxiliary component